ncbi:hypothetical protein KAI87_11015, partial [Myxococcota bacterium]|nr:hypothetical protein [Myxococcota bacterium]
MSLLIFSAQASAESVRYYELEGFGSFLDGDAKSTAVTERGTIILPPVVRERFADPAMAFSAATAWGEDVVV